MIQGSIVAIVTPMHEDGRLDEDAFRRLIDFHLENQTDAIVAVGTTGESATLTHEEHCQVVELAVKYVAKRVPLIAGTGSNATHEAIEFTRCAQQAGADACLLVTPYYNKPTQEGLYLHFKTVAEAVSIPQILYNVPGRTACDLQPDTVARLAQIENIIGIKDATSDLQRVAKHRGTCGHDFALYSGEDSSAMEFMLQGGNGVISVTANVAPKLMHEMAENAINGERETAEAINARLAGLHKGLFLESNPIPVKWAVHKLGLIKNGIRLPLTPFSEQHHDAVLQAMRTAGVMAI
jgi:4-hydroxy-tetrahydrodipicolinate synthase